MVADKATDLPVVVAVIVVVAAEDVVDIGRATRRVNMAPVGMAANTLRQAPGATRKLGDIVAVVDVVVAPSHDVDDELVAAPMNMRKALDRAKMELPRRRALRENRSGKSKSGRKRTKLSVCFSCFFLLRVNMCLC